MTADIADRMVLDSPVPAHPDPSVVQSAHHAEIAPASTPAISGSDADVALIPGQQAEAGGEDDVSMPSIQMPDEAALAAAAAAMAAAAQGHMGASDQQEAAEEGANVPDDLNSYLLAAAAASVHAQQQRNDDDQNNAQSEDSFDSTATPVPNSVYTNGTSVNGSEADDARTAIHDQCRKYTDDKAPYPLTIGKRTPGGRAEILANGANDLEHLPFAEASVELGKTRCYWALLSADHSKGNGPTGEKLHFVYLDPILQQHMAEQASRMVGSDFYDYVHPEERDRVSDDMQKIVESRTLFGSVTRCRYSRIPRIREVLGAVNPPRDPEADRYVEDDSFVAIDIVINWIGDGMLLCFFHAIIDKAHEDNDEQNKSTWTNWCGTPGGSFTTRQCDIIWKQVKATPRETVPDSGPVHVFQVIEAGGDGRVLLSWPPPRLFSRNVEAQLITQSDTTVFQDGSYFADDFARLAQGVSIAPGSSSLSDANTSCTRRFRAKHTLTTEGKVRSIESVLIPYGGVILACFHTTFQQQLPPPDPKLVLQAKATMQAQAERRKAEDDVSQSSPSKRPRQEGGEEAADITSAAQKAISNGIASELKPTAPQLKNGVAAVPQSIATTNGALPPQPSGQPPKTTNGHTPKTPVSKYAKPVKTESSGIAALANPSLMYTNAPTTTPKPPSTPTAAPRIPAAERATSTPTPNGTNGHSVPSPSGAESPSGPNKACTGCGKINSPEWRRGPSGHKTLCNACGLRYARSLTRRKKKKGKDGQVEFIEPTGDPSVVPKSRGGGGGSLPGVHRKNSKKRKEEEAAKAAAGGANVNGTAQPVQSGTPAGAASTASPSSLSATQSPAASTPAPLPATNADTVKPPAIAAPAAPVVKLEQADPNMANAITAAAAATTTPTSAPSTTETPAVPTSDTAAHDIAVSIALDAIASATASSILPLESSDTSSSLPLPVSNAISRAIAATIGSTNNQNLDAQPQTGNLLTSQSLSSPSPAPAAAAGAAETAAAGQEELDPNVSAAALQTIESVVSEALYKQLVNGDALSDTGLSRFVDDNKAVPDPVPVNPATTTTMTTTLDGADGGNEAAAAAGGGGDLDALDLSHALTADAIRAAAKAAVAQGVLHQQQQEEAAAVDTSSSQGEA